MSIATIPDQKVRIKSLTYRTSLDYVVARTAVSHSEGKPELRVGAPPEFKGQADIWTPEDVFVAALEVCLMLTFVGIAEKRGLRFREYDSSAEGLLEWHESSYRFTRLTVRPRMVVRDELALTLAREVMERAHQTCLIANSVRCEVIVNPEISVVPASSGRELLMPGSRAAGSGDERHPPR